MHGDSGRCARGGDLCDRSTDDGLHPAGAASRRAGEPATEKTDDVTFNGDITVLELTSGRVQATRQLSLEPTVSVNRVALPSASATSARVRLRASYTFTPRMFVSGLSQYNSSTGRVSTNVRLRWEYRAGSELFIVYTDEHDARIVASVRQPGKHGVVVKINRLFRWGDGLLHGPPVERTSRRDYLRVLCDLRDLRG